jgi:hypothetical protein
VTSRPPAPPGREQGPGDQPETLSKTQTLTDLKSGPTIPQRPDRNAAARYAGIVKLIADCCCVHCAGLGWALRDVDIELQQARDLGRAGDQVLAGGNPQLRWPSFAEYVARRLNPRRWTA